MEKDHNKQEENFDCVGFFRAVKEKISVEIIDMDFEELKHYFATSLAGARDQQKQVSSINPCPSILVFRVAIENEGEFVGRSITHPISVQANDLRQLHQCVISAIHTHFDAVPLDLVLRFEAD